MYASRDTSHVAVYNQEIWVKEVFYYYYYYGIHYGLFIISDCPDLCLCLESCCCNSLALSGTRAYVMDQYQLSSDPCDYRIIRFNNFMQCLDCICSILACFIPDVRPIARIIDHIADVVYCIVSGCMTSQVAIEMNYQLSKPEEAVKAYPVDASGGAYYNDTPGGSYVPPTAKY